MLATGNRHKIVEIRSGLAGLEGVRLFSFRDFPEAGPVEETGSTLEENALLKARAGYRLSGFPSLGDDTGLYVDALDGQPGIYAARYAGEGCTFDENIDKLLRALKGVPLERRTARFRCVMALVTGDQEQIVEGTIEGLIALERTGDHGFGYDPVFWVPERQCSFAQIPLEIKNRISHRGQALAKIRDKLFHLLQQDQLQENPL